MLKHTILIIAIVGIAIAYDTGSPANILFVDSDPHSEIVGLDVPSQPIGMSLDDFKDVIKHNMGLFSEDLSENPSKMEKISQYGNSNILKNKLLNYFFIVETSNDINSENKLFQRKLGVMGQTTLYLQICPFENNKRCIFDKFYNIEKEGSIPQELQDQYGDNHRDLLYYYSTEFEHNSLMSNYSLGLLVNQQNALELLEMQDDSVRSLSDSLETCINKNFEGEYFYNAKERSIQSKQNGNFLQVSEQQEYYMKEFLKDICGIIEIGQLVQKEKLPEFFTFHITSLGELEPFLKGSTKTMAQDMLTKAIGQFRESLKRHFEEDEISGQIMFLPFLGKGLEAVIQAESELELETNILLEKRILASQTTGAGLGDTNYPVMDDVNYQIYVWTFPLLIFTLWFTVYPLFTMENRRDSLLYAKFLLVGNDAGQM